MPEIQKKIKPSTFKSALTILNEMHFSANVTRSGINRGTKHIWWTSLKGDNFGTAFLRETSWEEIIEYAQQQTPVWDKAWLFEVGDVVEFEWFYKTKARGIIVRRGDCTRDYTIQSSAFKGTGVSDKRTLTNYDLKFHKKAVKIKVD